MNLNNIDEKLKQIAELYFLADKASKRLEVINHDLDVLVEDLRVHKKIMIKEHEDVVKLEKMSKYLLFFKILGDREKELEKERQEYLQSVLDYNAIAHEIQLLEYEKGVLERRAADKDSLKKQRDYYLKVKEQKILYNRGDHDNMIKKLNKEIERLSLLSREMDEAQATLKETEAMINKSMHFLSLIDDKFGAYEFNKLILTFSNKKYLSKAIDYAVKVKVQIKKLDKELSDVYKKYELPNVYKYESFTNSFHSNLISDWVLKNKLDSAMKSLKEGINRIHGLIDRIEEDQLKTHKTRETLIEEKRIYVLNS